MRVELRLGGFEAPEWGGGGGSGERIMRGPAASGRGPQHRLESQTFDCKSL